MEEKGVGMNMRDKIQEAVINYLKKKWWYVVLLFISSLYITYYRNEIGNLSRLDAMHLIFILWLFLLLYPLFSEIEIGSVKLKKEIEEVKETTKEVFRELRLQIIDTKVSNNNANSNMLILNSPLPSEQQLTELKKNVRSKQETDDELKFLQKEIDIPDQNVYLFKVRLAIEKRIRTLCDKMDYNEGKNLMATVRYLIKHEAIDFNMADAIEQIIHITNRGVHGEIISSKYIEFVKEVAPGILKQLDEIEKKYHICSKCGSYWYGDDTTSCPYCDSILSNRSTIGSF